MEKNEMKQFLEELSTELRAVAKASKAEVDQNWSSSSSSDREMRKMGSRDSKDIRAIAILVKSGKITTAKNKAENLDTIVREILPERFWTFSESVKGTTQRSRKVLKANP